MGLAEIDGYIDSSAFHFHFGGEDPHRLTRGDKGGTGCRHRGWIEARTHGIAHANFVGSLGHVGRASFGGASHRAPDGRTVRSNLENLHDRGRQIGRTRGPGNR